MGILYRNSQGVETPVAGLAPAGQLVPSVSLYQKGVINAEVTELNVLVTVAVTLSSSMPDTNYEVIITPPNVPNGTWAISNKTTTGFTFTFLKTAGNTGIVSFNYSAMKLMTDEVTALDEAKISQSIKNVAPNFSATGAYSVGDYVTYNNVLYRCTVAHAQSAWNSSHFEVVSVGGTLSSIVPSNASSSNKLVTESKISKTEKTLSIGGSASAIIKIDVSVPFMEYNYGKFTEIDFQVRSDNIRFFITANDGAYLVTAQHNYRSSGWLTGLGYLVNGSKSISLYVSILNYPADVGAKLVFNGLDGAEITGISTVSALPSGYAPMKQFPVIYTADLTSTVTSGSTAPITSGGVANVAGYCGQYTFDNGISIIIKMDSTAFRRVTIYQDNKVYSFIVHEWGSHPVYHWILGTELPSGITASYSSYRLTFTNNSFGTARMVIEAPSNPVVGQ